MTKDEDYRVKAARAGHAIYVPGKTPDEIAAKAAKASAHEAQKVSRVVELTNAQWSELDTAIPDVIELCGDVGNVFLELAYREDLDQPPVNSIMRLASRAVRSMERKEIEALDRLDTAIRHAKEGSSHAPEQ